MSTSRLRIGIDATPLLGTRSGIGIYVQHLVDGLAARDDLRVSAAAFSLRRRAPLGELPPAVHAVHRPVPARLLHRAWLRGDRPAAELVMGRQDVVHATNYVLPPPRRAAAVVSVHDLSFLHYPDLVNRASLDYRTLVPRAVRRADAVLVLSEAVKAEVIDAYGVPADRVRVVPLGVDPAWFDAAGTEPVTGLPSEYLVALGTVEPRKGLDVLLRAYATLDDPPPLVLAGAAGWGPDLDLHGLDPDRVIRPGYLPVGTVRSLVAHARALVYPSRYEGFGIPPLEALAAGTPVVASDLAPVREVVGGFARLSAAGDVDALAAHLRDVLDSEPDPEQRERGRRHAATFTWARTVDQTVAAYRAVTGRS